MLDRLAQTMQMSPFCNAKPRIAPLAFLDGGSPRLESFRTIVSGRSPTRTCARNVPSSFVPPQAIWLG
jgi:hypothetical protein